EGRVTLASCNADEKSYEDSEKKHGVFTYFLAKGLKGDADTNGDGLVGVGELHVYVRRAVIDWGQRSGRRQTPRVQMNVSGEIVLGRNEERFKQVQAQRATRHAEWQKLRESLQRFIGDEKLAPATAAPLLASLDRLLAGRGADEADHRRVTLAQQFIAGALTAANLSAELGALNANAPGGNAGCDEEVPSNEPGSPKRGTDIKVQLFQPSAETAAGDEFTLICQPGEELKIVGLAQAPEGVTKVTLDCRELPSSSIEARDFKLVSAVPTDMRFSGTLRAGHAPSVATLVIYDAEGARRSIRLHLKPGPAITAGITPLRKPAIAVIGLSRKPELDTYEDLRPLRIGMDFTENLTSVARDSGRVTLVNGNSEVLRNIVSMQWQQQQAAFDKDQAVRAGRLVGARFVLYGVIYYFALPSENDGELSLKIELRLVDVETNLLYPAYGQASVTALTRQANGREFSRKNLDQAASLAMTRALNDLWDYLGKQGVLAPQGVPSIPLARTHEAGSNRALLSEAHR
ncbi:MAG TPA: hypothetical protein VF719_07005, partial [Abditibacteriaceae bacterium]